MSLDKLTRRDFVAGAGTVLASVTVALAGGGKAFASEGTDATTTGIADGTTNGAAASPAASKIVILATNDLHGTLENPRAKLGYAALASYAAAQRELYGTGLVTVTDCGDVSQGDPFSSLCDDQFPARAMGASGYDVAVPGNHDFDNGVEALVQAAATENLALTCCNFTDAAGACVFEPYHVIEYPAASGTVRVAYVGVTTPTTRGSKDIFKDSADNFIYDFAIDETGDALASAVQQAADDARNKAAADYVVLLAHLGQSWSPAIWRSDTLVSKTNGIDAVLDAHTHQLYAQTVANKDGAEVPIVQAGSRFCAISRLEIDLAARTATASAVATGVTGELVRSWDGRDGEVTALIDEFDAKIAQVTGEVIGTTEVDLIGLADDGTQATWLGETNLGDLAADAIFSAAKAAGTPCDVAFHDPFGIFSDINKGEVTQGSLLAAFPYNSTVGLLEVTGRHLLDVLETGCSRLPEPDSCLLQPSAGFAYTVRTDIESPVSFTATGHAFGGIEGQRRITSATLNGQDIETDGRYVVAMPAGMLAKGSVGMPVPENASEATELGKVVDFVVRYIREDLGDTIGEAYGNAAGDGRITILDDAGEQGGAAASSTASTGGSLPMAAATALAVGAVATAAARGN